MITRSTVGKLMIEDALPEEMRGRNITFDKKNMSTLLKELADKHPDKYVDVTKKLSDIGRQVATETGGYSIGLSHLKQAAGTKKTINEIRQKLTGFLADTRLNDKQRNESIIRSVGGYQQSLMDDVYKEGLAAKNPIAMQIMSGSRGNKMNLSSLLGSDLLYEDHRGDIIPVPVLKSYSQGLTPAEYWAGTYGARKSIISTKFATADAGFFGKQLNQVTHRLSVVDQDDPRQDLAVRGLPVDTDDMDNEGALLAHDFGGYKRNTVLTPKILKDLKARNFDRILVRSPMTGGSPDGGVYARDVGVRERGTLPGRGEMVGMTAAQAIAEPISQGQLSAKHSGGVAGQEKTVGGFQYINQLIQVPKTFKGGAAHTTVDGRVQKIEDAPAGGKYVFINDKPQYVGSGFDLKVKLGDDVEAGDIISDGMPNPSIITEHKGIGEGRKYFVKAFRDSMGSMGLRSHRRNIELIGRGLIDHVRMTEEYGDHVPDDVIPYSTLEHGYKPREGFQTIEPSRALNKYLEKPVLHYSIGTKVRPGMLKDMQYFGVKDITVHDKPAPFQPEMVRAMYNLHHDPDWMTRMYGSGLKSSLLDATHRGSTSSATGTSFVPGLAKSVDFGRVGQVRQSEPGLKPDLNTPVATPMTPNTDTEKLSSANLYHGSSLRLNNVEPRPSRVINNEAAVFGTPNRELALSFMAPWTDADLSLGSTNNEPYVLEERYPGAFEKIYKGKSGFLHHLPSADFAEDPRLMPTERIARKAVKPANVEEIKNLWDALQTSGIVLKRHGDKSNNKIATDDILPQQHIKFAEVYTANGDSVQGVGLRKLYHALLDEKGISGLGVNNEETGNVELAFNGDEAQRKNVFDELATRIQAKTGKPVTFAPLSVPQQMTPINLSNADAARLNAIHHLAYRMSNMYDPSDAAMHDDATFKQNMADRFRLAVTDKGLTGTVPSRAAEQLLGTRPMYSAMAPEYRVRDEDEAMKDMAPEHKQKLLSMLGTDRGFLSNKTNNSKFASDDILPGGIGDKYNVSDFSKKEMAKGVKTESEHTTNPAIAADISKDHLVEDPKYYTKLEKVEKKSAYSIADGIANVRRKDDTLSQLLEAKKHSDAKRYDHKNAILRKLMRQSPQDWVVDDADAKHYGVTHVPTSFRLHTDPNVIPVEVTRQKQAEVPPAVPAPAPATPAPAPNTNVYAAPPKPRRMFDNILPEVRPGAKGFLHNFKQTLGDVATLTNPRRSNLSSNWDFDAIGGSANSNRRQEYSSGSDYQASEPYAAPAPAAASAPAAAASAPVAPAPAPVTPAQPQTAAPAPVAPVQPQTAAPATPAQAQTAIPFDIERNAQTLEAGRARQALPQINHPPISDSSVLDMMTRESFGDLASMYGYNRLAPMFSKAPAVAAAATAGAAVPAAVAATPISKLTSLLSHNPMLSSLKFLKSNPGTALALDIGTTEFANRSMKDTVLAQGRQMESYRDALARANDEYASNNMLDVGKAALNLGTFGLSSYLPGFAPTGAGVVASSGVMSALSPYSTAYRYLADKHIRDTLGNKGVSDFERQQAVDLAARENPMMREGLVAAGPPRDWAGWWKGDKPPETDYKTPQKYRTWQQWNPVSNYMGNALRGIGVNSTWGRGEAEKIVDKNSPELQHIMATRKMVFDLLMREDKTQASQLIANLYKDPESYAALKEKLPPSLMNQLEKLHAHNEIAATPAMVAAKAKQKELDQRRSEDAFGRPHPRFLPQPTGLLPEFSNYQPQNVPNPEQTAKDNESMQNAAWHARDILLNATQNPRALAAGEFDASLKWLAQRGLINRDSNAISSDVKKRVAALVPETESLQPIPLKQFETIPAAPETKVKAISRLDDKQFIEYARRMFDAVYPAPQSENEPLSLLKGLQQINARSESLRELQSLPPELVEKLRKSYQEWQDYALPGPGRYNINEAPPTREATPNARMSQGTANQQMAVEQAKRDADRRKYQYQRPRQ